MKKHIPSCFSKETSISEKISFLFIQEKENDKTEQHNTLNPSQSIKQQKRSIEKQITAQNTSEWLLFRVNIFSIKEKNINTINNQ
ncbi:hypothetical protein ECDEC11A_5360 [Escherichia coli DEC11A]|uniref:hypothetical protein n=1 Tax=Escherichia coli TaxID=562 RepID=UPI0002512403|nr:hypothetical protein [Escherichia coli]EHW97997.1 hypothetical protein ECDEC11A_5360 [Escherichia coli DEC11A]